MNEIVDFIKDARTFFLATVDNNVPRVRPFGFIMEYNGKLCFSTANNKDVYKQMQANPNVEICACNASGEWIRICGKVKLGCDIAAKEKVFEISPQIGGIYKTADNPIFEVFCLEEGQATFYSFASEPRTVQL